MYWFICLSLLSSSDDSLFEYGSGKLLRREPVKKNACTDTQKEMHTHGHPLGLVSSQQVCRASELRFFLLSNEEHQPFARHVTQGVLA